MHFLTLLASLFHARIGGDIGGTVADSAVGTPLVGGEVRILQGGNVIATAVTDAFGRYVIHNLPAGAYRVEVRYLGYRAQTQDLSVGTSEGLRRADCKHAPLPITLSAGEVATPVP